MDYSDPASFFRAMGAGGPGSNLPMPEMISAKTVRSNAKACCSKVVDDWQLLQAILARHEATLQKRWAKKTKQQRLKTLLSVWPGMPAHHRPDFDAFRRESPHERERSTRFKDAYMWPYINQDDLSKPRVMPLFLNARGRHQPSVFAMADENASHLGIVSKAIIPAFLNEHVMYFKGTDFPQHYSELVAWDDDDAAFDDLTTGRGMHPGHGLLILEQQQRVYRFLVDCCKEILHTIPANQLTSDDYPTLPEPPLVSESATGFASLAVMAAEAPYRVPASLDLARLQSILSAKVSAAEDHIWALREDPSYFADSLIDFKEHRQEMIKDIKGQVHPLFKLRREEVFWNRVIGNIITNAYIGLEIWNELLQQVLQLQFLQAKYADVISPDKDLPAEYFNALLRFKHYLDQASKGPLGQLKHTATASPPLRAYFIREVPESDMSTKILMRQKPGLKLDKVETEVFWLLQTLWEDGEQLFLAGLTNVVDELERLVQAEPTAKQMVSSYIASVLADLSVITEAIRQLNIYQPWAQTFEHYMAEKDEEIKAEYASKTQHWAQLLGVTKGSGQMKIIKLGDPSGKKFHYPVDKRRTKENVDALRAAEQSLDAFWEAVDRNMQARSGAKLDGTAVRRVLAQPRRMQRTPEWIEPAKVGKEMKLDADVEAITKPLSDLYFELERRTEATIDHSSDSKTGQSKDKTRGVAAQSYAEAGVQDAPPSAAPDKQPIFTVDARALKVFRTLFYTPSVSATPGEVVWTDFLHAMVSVGFAIEKLYGSVWQFQPSRLDVERSIQFHEPHPSGKMGYRVARRVGRRLERTYGWWGGMFVLKQKEVVK